MTFGYSLTAAIGHRLCLHYHNFFARPFTAGKSAAYDKDRQT
ncbi:Uncharacterised protein [Serratia proteamaculans]|nr:Uncharacterised protein [Serratia proteamaculans]